MSHLRQLCNVLVFLIGMTALAVIATPRDIAASTPGSESQAWVSLKRAKAELNRAEELLKVQKPSAFTELSNYEVSELH